VPAKGARLACREGLEMEFLTLILVLAAVYFVLIRRPHRGRGEE
jgi:hypothetical protein